MNKKMKKLGLLVVSALAMTMGVNSANALTITGRANNDFANPSVTDTDHREVTVVQTAVNTYTITVVDSSFNAGITINAGENVTINLNGRTLASNITNKGNLTFIGNSSSYMIGKLTNTGTTTLTIEGGNYARMNMPALAGVTHVRGIGTVVPSSISYAILQSEGFKAVANGDNTVTVAEADADMSLLKKAVDGTNGLLTHTWSADKIKYSEAKFTKSSFATWKTAYEAAMNLLNKGTLPYSQQTNIDTVKLNYIAAVNALESIADYSVIDEHIADAEAKIASGKYTEESLAKLKAALAAVVRDLPKSKENLVRQMRLDIDDALNSLKEKVNYSEIERLMIIISSMNPESYTDASWAKVEAAVAAIEWDLADTSESRALVKSWEKQLVNAITGLEEVKAGSTNPGDDEPSNPGTSEPSNPGTNPGNTGSNEPSNQGTTTNPSDTGNTNPNTPSNPSNQGNNNGGNNNSSSTVNPNTDETGTTSDVNTRDNVVVYAVMNIASLIALAGCGLVLRKQN